MEERSKNEVVYYYDLHPTEEDLMGESNPPLDLVTYLMGTGSVSMIDMDNCA